MKDSGRLRHLRPSPMDPGSSAITVDGSKATTNGSHDFFSVKFTVAVAKYAMSEMLMLYVPM